MTLKTSLPFFGVVRVSGEERSAFLHGQLSNHIEALAAGDACYATYNTPKGRVLANMLVLNRGDDFLLAMAADLIEPTVKRLRMFVMRSKVVFEILPDYAVACELEQNAPAVYPAEPALTFAAQDMDGVWRIALPHQGYLNIGVASALPAYDAASENAWQRHEINSGYPWISAASSESSVAQMLNQHVIGGVHFKKGCYPGQEIIARAQYRGQVKRGLAVLAGKNILAAGAKVLQEREEAGVVINAAAENGSGVCLAVIKYAAAVAALTDESGAVLTVRHCFFTVESE